MNIESGFSKEEQLYDLSKDPSQKNNIAASNPELLKEIRTRFLKITEGK